MARVIHNGPDGGSFRDPCGFVFYRDGRVFRQINKECGPDYERLMHSGLYRELVDSGLLIPHQEVEGPSAWENGGHKIIEPVAVPFISYPYEWCFSQLKEAALLTLQIQARALAHGMTLKDASAYNVQFMNGKAVFIDTLSFETHEGGAWVAYAQFCRHFVAPLSLMSFRDHRLGAWAREFMDGVPLELASRLLPAHSYFNPLVFTHIHCHAKAQAFAGEGPVAGKQAMHSNGLKGILDHLESGIKALKQPRLDSAWINYSQEAYPPEEARQHKREIIRAHIERFKPGVVWDIGCNTGECSWIASEAGAQVIGLDADVHVIEAAHAQVSAGRGKTCLFLCVDITNPSPALGWGNRERMSLTERGPADMVLCLGLVHHLAITGHIPLDKIAAYCAQLTKSVLIEFVSPEDPQAQALMRRLKGPVAGYTQAAFEKAFSKFFKLEGVTPLRGAQRTVYLWK